MIFLDYFGSFFGGIIVYCVEVEFGCWMYFFVDWQYLVQQWVGCIVYVYVGYEVFGYV